MAKIRTFIENHWEAPTDPAQVGQTGEMLGRLTDEYGNPMQRRSVALRIAGPDIPDTDIHGIITDMDGVMRYPIKFGMEGTYWAFYWFGGDTQYEGC